MKVALASDHAGYKLKERIKAYLGKCNTIFVEDYGTFSTDSVDYPDYGSKAAIAVQEGSADRAILVCKTGIGMSIIANKFRTIRAALCHDKETILMSRKHNNANVLVLGAYLFEDSPEVNELITLWLKTEFEGGRHQRRVDKLNIPGA
ncbi:MAG: ribose 5-phosphate isomerase B [Candidatus Fischerbacteria bacterium RBG_13_37_8]|uniref:Ribose 5-phosphate isomerase B n=1 Tax=Candidatus Fischerbacteria bacterium RBG_13_37_8 TaxID=1817863 RepID=A0A1F5V4K6_9BACT|nr:MAG: ribose 5-phosphate isomerase B [Candidatus Fischerbacteria bacterium RBG_13_37_8]